LSRHTFPAAAFADQPQDTLLFDRKRHIIHSFQSPGFKEKVRFQTIDFNTIFHSAFLLYKVFAHTLFREKLSFSLFEMRETEFLTNRKLLVKY
jgi:hypothetical protein